MAKISVIIPVFNAEKFIQETVGSVLQQTFEDFELILVNDGSTDDSGRLCRQLAKIDSRIIFLEQNNKGVSVARNLGKKYATGEYIIFIDADDVMKISMLEKLYSQAIKYEADISICGIEKTSKVYKQTLEIEHEESKPVCIDKAKALELLCLNKIIELGVWNKLFKMSAIKSIDFIEGKRINEDKYFVFQALMNVEKVIYCHDKLYIYVDRDNSVTKQVFSERWFDLLYFANKIYSELENNKKLEKVARYQMILSYYTVLRKVYPYRKKYCHAYKEIVAFIRKVNLEGVFKYFEKKQKIGLLLVKYNMFMYKCMRVISKIIK